MNNLSNANSLKYSFIISFRDRDLMRVARSLDSLQQQTQQNFEVVFVNYGSSSALSEELKILLSRYKFCNYIYSETRGLLWNKCIALNIGIFAARGENVIISDIDIIYRHDFISRISSYDMTANFLSFNAIYLQQDSDYQIENITSYENLHIGFIGLLIVKKQYLIYLNGYDDFYQIWGAEDEDIIKRLKKMNINQLHISTPDIDIFHQWHPLNSPRIPSLWFLQLVNYLHTNQDIIRNSEQMFVPKDISERPALNILLSDEFHKYKKLELQGKQLHCYLKLYQDFFALPSSEVCYFEIDNWHTEIVGKLSKFVNIINKFLDRLKKIHYRFVRIEKLEAVKEINFEDLNHFWEYFIGMNRAYIKDYYYERTDKKILVVLIKK